MYICIVCMWFAICKNVYNYICGMCICGIHVCRVLVFCACKWCTDVYMCDMLWVVCLCVHWDMCKHMYIYSYIIVFYEHLDICLVIHLCLLGGCFVLYVMCVCVFSVCTCVSMCTSTLLIFGCLGTPASHPFSIYWLSFQRSSGQMFLM